MDYRRAIIRELQGMLDEPDRRFDHIKTFQRWIWEHDDFGFAPSECEILRDLALDLDYYRQDERLGDLAYYGDGRLKAEVQSVLKRLQVRT